MMRLVYGSSLVALMFAFLVFYIDLVIYRFSRVGHYSSLQKVSKTWKICLYSYAIGSNAGPLYFWIHLAHFHPKA